MVVIEVLMALAVLAVPLPALVLGASNVLQRSGRYSPDLRADRIGLVLLVLARVVGLLLIAALSVVVLISTVGAAVQDLELPNLVYVFFVLDLLLAALVLLTFGLDPRGRRRGIPARR